MMRNICRAAIHSVILAALVFLGAHQAFAHCDGMDGPVVIAAQKALETGNVNLVLIWVRKNDEGEVKSAFQKTLAVRKLSQQAKEYSDMYFFETLVRVHRAAEGEPYTGLKPAGRDLGPAIPTADKALESGKVEPLLKLLTDSMQTVIREKFKQAMAKKKYRADDVETGRAYVEAYVPFVRYVEQIYEAVKSPSDGHLHHVEREAAHK
jgi:uncharacterized protein DUF6448